MVMMKKNAFSFRVELVLYAVIFLMGLVLRLSHLGKLPLSDEEARLALQALSLARGEGSPFFNSDGGYLVITAALFYVFSANDYLARLLPAILGSIICVSPFAFREWLGGKTALLVAIALAFDGGWLAAAREAGSTTWSVLFFLSIIWALSCRRWKTAGIFSGLLILGGVEVWKGLIPFGIAVWGYRLWFDRDGFQKSEIWRSIKPNLKEIMLWAGGAVLFFGSMFLILPAGLSAAGGGLIAYLRGWNSPSGVSVGLILAAMLVYQPISTLLGLAGSIRQIKQPASLERFFVIWWLFALLHTLIYPARQALDIVWISIPLIGLAAGLLSSLLRFDFDQRIPALVYGGVIFVFLLFTAQNLMALFSPGRVAVNTQPQIIAILAAVFFVIISIILIGWGWSRRVAGYGAVWGLVTVLTLFWLSGSFHAAGLGENLETNPFLRGGVFSEADLLRDSIENLAEFNVRSRTGMDVLAVGLDRPAMRWFAREYPNFMFENVFQPQVQSSMVLTATTEGVIFGENYRGQDFHWEVQPIWNLMTPQEWMQWAIFKVAPLENKTIVLWARETLFPGSENLSEVQP